MVQPALALLTLTNSAALRKSGTLEGADLSTAARHDLPIDSRPVRPMVVDTPAVPTPACRLRRDQMVINGVRPGMHAAEIRRLHGHPAAIAPVVPDPRLPGKSEIWHYDGEASGPVARSLSIELYNGHARIIYCVSGLSDCIIAGVKSGRRLADFERMFGPPTERRPFPTLINWDYRAQDTSCHLTVRAARNGRIEAGVVECQPAGLPQ